MIYRYRRAALIPAILLLFLLLLPFTVSAAETAAAAAAAAVSADDAPAADPILTAAWAAGDAPDLYVVTLSLSLSPPPSDGVAGGLLTLCLPDGWETVAVSTPASGLTLTYRTAPGRVDILLDSAENIPLSPAGDLLILSLRAPATTAMTAMSLYLADAYLYTYNKEGEPIAIPLPDGEIPRGMSPSKVTDETRAEESTEGSVDEILPVPGDDPTLLTGSGVRYVGCIETEPHGGVYAVQFLFAVPTAAADISAVAYPVAGGGAPLRVNTWLTGRWYIIRFDGLSTDITYRFCVTGGDPTVPHAVVTYAAGVYAGIRPGTYR